MSDDEWATSHAGATGHAGATEPVATAPRPIGMTSTEHAARTPGASSAPAGAAGPAGTASWAPPGGPTKAVGRLPLGIVLLLGVALAGCAADGEGVTPSPGSPAPTGATSPDATDGAAAAPTATAGEPAVPDELPSPLPTPEEGIPDPRDPSPGAPGPGGGTELVVEVTDASGAVARYTLTCDPPSGSHPDPEAACASLAEAATATDGDPFRPTPPDAICTQQYGGPETASVTGTVDGRSVRASLSLRNGCEIDRWSRLGALLSPFADADAGGGVTS